MPRLYRTQTIEAIYAALQANATLATLLGGTVKIIRQNHGGRIRRLEWRAPKDLAFVEVLLGPGHGGDIFRIQNFDHEVLDAVRSADYTLECVWGQHDYDTRDAVEGQILASLSGLPDSVDGIASVTFRSSTGRASIAGQKDQREATRIIVTCAYQLAGSDIQP